MTIPLSSIYVQGRQITPEVKRSSTEISIWPVCISIFKSYTLFRSYPWIYVRGKTKQNTFEAYSNQTKYQTFTTLSKLPFTTHTHYVNTRQTGQPTLTQQMHKTWSCKRLVINHLIKGDT